MSRLSDAPEFRSLCIVHIILSAGSTGYCGPILLVMNISVDPVAAKRDAHAVLVSHFDAYAAETCDIDEFREALIAICEANKEASWDALALLDQYQRRGVLNAQTAKQLKTRISHIVFGMPLVKAPRRQKSDTSDSAASPQAVAPAPEPLVSAPAAVETPLPATVAAISPAEPVESESPPSERKVREPPPLFAAAVAAAKSEEAAERPKKTNGLDPRWRQRIARRRQEESARAKELAKENIDEDFDAVPESRSPVDLAQPDEDFFRQTGTDWPKIEIPENLREAAAKNEDVLREQSSARPRLDSSVWVLSDVEPRAVASAESSAAESPATAPPPPTVADALPPAVGQTLSGRYVLKQLQSQRNGVYYFKALDLHRDKFTETERYVGIKLIHLSNDARGGELTRLESEFRKMQQLAHPNILKVFDLDHNGNRHFITTQWLPGIKLSELLLPLGTEVLAKRHTLTLIHSVGSALAHAHAQGIVHGDLHPDHVLLTETGDIKLNGFAFDAAEWQEPAFDSQAVAIVSARNTLAYASCERLAGAGVDERSDIYSLAVLSYQLLAGRHPFNGLLATQARDDRRKPSRVPGLTALQWRALRRALAWTRTKRSSSVRDLLRDLGAQNVTDRLPALAQVQSAARSTEPPHWRAALWLAACLVLFAAAAVIAVRRDPSLVSGNTAKNESPASAVVTPAPAAVAPRTSVKNTAPPPGHREFSQTAPTHRAVSETPTMPEPTPVTRAPELSTVAESPALAAAVPTQVPVPAVHAGAGVLSFTEDTYSVGPGEGTARISVKRRSGTHGPISFRWWTVPGSAHVDGDYVPVQPRVEEMAAGQDKATLVVPVVADATRRRTEYFEVQIADPEGGAQLGENARATVILVASQ